VSKIASCTLNVDSLAISLAQICCEIQAEKRKQNSNWQ